MKVVHCKREQYDVYIGRPGPWGNPFAIGKDGNREDVIRKYELKLRLVAWMLDTAGFDFFGWIHSQLNGKTLACWCAPQACHGDVLARICNVVEGR